MTDQPAAPRRRRRRATAAQGAPARRSAPGQPDAELQAPPVEQVASSSKPARSSEGQQRRGRNGSRAAERNAAGATERSVRDLIGAGPSQVGVSGALRARDVNRPTEQDLAEAAETVVIVRRNWQPPPKR